MNSFVSATYAECILTVMLNRPKKRNALSTSLIAELAAVFTAWRTREELAVAVLTGNGEKAFAAGGDLDELNALRTEDQALAFASESRAALDTIRYFPVPVVAFLNGDALGGGAELALACDLRIAAAHARIGFLQARLNIATAWGGGTDLMQLLGTSRALELLCTAKVLDANQAFALGLVDAVAPSDGKLADFVQAYIERLATQKPQVMRAFKSLAILHRFGTEPKERAAAEGTNFARTWVHQDHWTAVDRMAKQRG